MLCVLPEPGTAAEWTERGFGSIFSHREIKRPNVKKNVVILGGGVKRLFTYSQPEVDRI